MEATSSIPIVSPTLGDPVATGVVSSLGHPGGNLTGLRLMTTEMSGKRQELLKEAVPGIARPGLLVNPANPNADLEMTQAEVVGQALGVHPIALEVRQPDDFDHALGLALRGQADALLTTVDVLMYEQRAAIVEFAARNRLPTMHYARLAVAEGGFMAYDMVHAENYRRAAGYVAKILKGAKPADLPVEQPTKFDLVVNLQTARALGLNVPPSILQQATEIIQESPV
jgi:putative ABC transport system substrate-binding protein